MTINKDSNIKSSDGIPQKSINLWQDVLDGASSGKAIQTKNIVIMGDENSGKSAVVAQILKWSQNPGVGNGFDSKSLPSPNLSNEKNSELDDLQKLMAAGKNDIGLSYVSVDVKDEDNEDIISRLGIYQIASDQAVDRELLKQAITSENLLNTAVVIVLDWSKPLRFIKSLLRWIDVLRETIGYLYKDKPKSNSSEKNTEQTQTNIKLEGHKKVLLPLENGVLETNFGIPISDAMAQIEREQRFTDDDFDYIQQTLRTVCLHYGAALFYTTIMQPRTFAELRHYLLHRLITKTESSNDYLSNSEYKVEGEGNTDNSNISGNKHFGSNSATNVKMEIDQDDSDTSEETSGVEHLVSAYPFRLPAQVIERDLVIVPSGWDSKAKIKFLRDNFDLEMCLKSWKLDYIRYKSYTSRLLELLSDPNSNPRCNLEKIIKEAQNAANSMLTDKNVIADFPEITENQSGSFSLSKTYMDVIGSSTYLKTNFGANLVEEVTNMNSLGVTVAESEQSFFQRLHAEQLARADTEDSSDRMVRQTRVNVGLSKVPENWKATQSRYNSSENTLSTASVPFEEPESNLKSENDMFSTNGVSSNPLRSQLDTDNTSPKLSANPSLPRTTHGLSGRKHNIELSEQSSRTVSRTPSESRSFSKSPGIESLGDGVAKGKPKTTTNSSSTKASSALNSEAIKSKQRKPATTSVSSSGEKESSTFNPELLNSFFQNLLSKKTTGSNVAARPTTPGSTVPEGKSGEK
ncbi:hypothetical protein BB558_006066 [Smittium angustum]|uniref:Dynein light intermediate chain n=1 Tax=Smittium angustum TaxID=133377 RepID=A0A2U1IYU3_SMIAN|nr:hypothetical protein BB558_006066 [Smittium angustum]